MIVNWTNMLLLVLLSLLLVVVLLVYNLLELVSCALGDLRAAEHISTGSWSEVSAPFTQSHQSASRKTRSGLDVADILRAIIVSLLSGPTLVLGILAFTVQLWLSEVQGETHRSSQRSIIVDARLRQGIEEFDLLSASAGVEDSERDKVTAKVQLTWDKLSNSAQ